MEQLDGREDLGPVLRVLDAEVVQVSRLQLPEQLEVLVPVQQENGDVLLRDKAT